MRVGLLHVQVGCVETRVDSKVELVHRVVGNGHARGGSLRVVDHGVDAAELFDGLIDNVLNHGLVVLTSRNVCLHGQHLDAVFSLEALLGILELGHVAAGDNEVRALFGERDIDAIADGSSAAVLERRLAAAGHDHGFPSNSPM